MPQYTYHCPNGHSIDLLSRFVEPITAVTCDECGDLMRRQDFYAPAVHVAGAVAAPSATPERNEADKRALAAKGWDYSRTLETIRKNRREDATGKKVLDIAAMNREK